MTKNDLLAAAFRAMADHCERLPTIGHPDYVFTAEDFLDVWCDENPFYKRLRLPESVALDESAVFCMFCQVDEAHAPDCPAGYLEAAAQGRVTGNMTLGRRK